MFEPMILTLPLPDAASPVAVNAAVPPALILLLAFFVLSTDDVGWLPDEPQHGSILIRASQSGHGIILDRPKTPKKTRK